MEGAVGERTGKLGYGMLRYSQNPIVAVIDSQKAGQNLRALTGISSDVPILDSVEACLAAGAEVLVLGIAPSGGLIPEEWHPAIRAAVAGGMSIVNGLHDALGPRFPDLKPGQYIWDVRQEPNDIGVADGSAAALSNRRVLMVGTDMAVGKMTAGLELQRALVEQGVRCGFLATGQIGIILTGGGIPLDAIRVDYASGAVQRETLRHREDEVTIIEGQGALGHPGSTSTLPLLRGSMPTHLVLCHRARTDHLDTAASVPIPPLGAYIQLYEDVASVLGVFLRPATLGVALNTALLDVDSARKACDELSAELGLPVTDPVRFGAQPLIERLLTQGTTTMPSA